MRPTFVVGKIRYKHAWCNCKNAVHEPIYHQNIGPLPKANKMSLAPMPVTTSVGQVKSQNARSKPRRKVNFALVETPVPLFLTLSEDVMSANAARIARAQVQLKDVRRIRP